MSVNQILPTKVWFKNCCIKKNCPKNFGVKKKFCLKELGPKKFSRKNVGQKKLTQKKIWSKRSLVQNRYVRVPKKFDPNLGDQLGRRGGANIVFRHTLHQPHQVYWPLKAKFGLLYTSPGGGRWAGGQNLIIQLSQPSQTGTWAELGKI